MDEANDVSTAKRAAGEAGAALVESGMRIGLGSGSTAAHAVRAVGRRLREGELTDVAGVPTSFATERRAREEGIPLTTLDGERGLDLALDGADEIDPALDLIKGGGAAHTREKIVADEAERFVVVADSSKDVERLGDEVPVPVEVVPMATGPVTRFLEARGAATVELRTGDAKDGPVVTDQGQWILDARFTSDGIADPVALVEALDRRPGVVGHGLFLDAATDVLVGQTDGTVEHRVRN